MRWLVTGFGPFGNITDNISARLARALSPESEVIEVSFEASETFVRTAVEKPFDAWLALGVNDRASLMRLETTARNRIGPTADVNGVVRAGQVIVEGGPDTIASRLWTGIGEPVPGGPWEWSDDAGGYLCNFLFYLASRAFPDRLVGFLHVPNEGSLDFDTQLGVVRLLMMEIEQHAATS